jgi:hypothetical protein
MSKLRDKALRFTPFREKALEIKVPTETGEPEVLKFLLRQPSVSQRNQILAESRSEDAKKLDAGGLGKAQCMAVILCALDPDTRQPAFDVSDLDTLLGLPAGGWLDELSGAVMGLMAEGEQAAKT